MGCQIINPILDCEQCLIFFRFSEGSARAATKLRDARAAAQEENREAVHITRTKLASQHKILLADT